MINTAKGKHALSYCFFSIHEAFPSIFLPDPSLLDLLKEKHPFPGGAQNTYQTGKKKGKKNKAEFFFFFPGVKNLFETELCILSRKLIHQSNA